MAPIYLGKMVVPLSLRYIENLAPRTSELFDSETLKQFNVHIYTKENVKT